MCEAICIVLNFKLTIAGILLFMINQFSLQGIHPVHLQHGQTIFKHIQAWCQRNNHGEAVLCIEYSMTEGGLVKMGVHSDLLQLQMVTMCLTSHPAAEICRRSAALTLTLPGSGSGEDHIPLVLYSTVYRELTAWIWRGSNTPHPVVHSIQRTHGLDLKRIKYLSSCSPQYTESSVVMYSLSSPKHTHPFDEKSAEVRGGGGKQVQEWENS